MRRSLLLTLGHPDWWAVSPAAFLVRGGILVVALPVLALPSLAGLSAVVAPLLTGVVLGDSSIPPIVLLAGAAALVSAVLFITGHRWRLARRRHLRRGVRGPRWERSDRPRLIRDALKRPV